MKVLALFGELPHEAAQLFDAAFSGADRHALFALGIGARLARVQPILHGAREQAVRDVPDVGLVVGVSDPVTEIDCFAEGFAEWIIGFLHGVVLGSLLRAHCRAPLALARIVPEAPGLLEERDGRWSTDGPHMSSSLGCDHGR